MSYVKCAKHLSSKEKLWQNESRERDLVDALEKHDKQTHRKGETVNEETKVYSEAFSLVQPSSATAKRVLSLLGQTFWDQRQNALENLVEASVMLQFNSR